MIKKTTRADLRGKKTFAMVSLDGESVGSVYDDTDENFCQPFSKQRRNSDHVLFHVSRNIASTSQLVMAADSHKILNNTLNDIIASIITKRQGCVEDFALSKLSTLR